MTQRYDPSQKMRGREKMLRVPVEVIQENESILQKPDWIRVPLRFDAQVGHLKSILRKNRLTTVCEEAMCPNLPECFGRGTATFMIMGDKCTRRCSFCAVGHGRPDPLDADEPEHLADVVLQLGLRYVVITSVDRDDLRDGGAAHFASCIRAIRARDASIRIEILVPDFRGRLPRALDALSEALPDVFNHNIETVPRLYRAARPGSDYLFSLNVLSTFKTRFAGIPTKSGLMLGLGEESSEIETVLQDLRAHQVDVVTLGQYLQPSVHHLSVARYVAPEEFAAWKTYAESAVGFSHVESGPLVRSSYHADRYV